MASDREIIEQYYKCQTGHYVLVEGEDVDPHNDIIIDLHCIEHDSWMQPVPEPTQHQEDLDESTG